MADQPNDRGPAIRGFAERVRVEFGLDAETDVAVEEDGGAASAGFGAQGQRQSGTVADASQGRAIARAMDSFDDAAAYGLLVQRIEPAEGDRRLTGEVQVEGTGEAEGRGLSIGLQEFLDPDETHQANADDGGDREEAFGPEDALPRFVGMVETGSGNDRFVGHSSVRADASLEVIADGPENVGLIDLGPGDDLIRALSEAVASAPVGGGETAGQPPAETIVSGLLTENAVTGVVLGGEGDDRLNLTGLASGRSADTAAFGLSSVNFDIPAAGLRAGVDLGGGRDRLDARADASGSGDVAAYGIWGGRTEMGDGADAVRAEATARTNGGYDPESGEFDEADAVGVNLDDDFTLFGDTASEDASIRSEEGAILDLGAGDDLLHASAEADSSGIASRAVGLFVGEDGELRAGEGDDRIVAEGELLGRGQAFAIAGEETGRIETGAGDDLVDAARGGFDGGLTVALGEGDDLVRGFGDARIEGGAGLDVLQIGESFEYFSRFGATGESDGTVTLESGGFEMITTGIESYGFDGEILTAEELVARLSEGSEEPDLAEDGPDASEPAVDEPDPLDPGAPPVGLA